MTQIERRIRVNQIMAWVAIPLACFTLAVPLSPLHFNEQEKLLVIVFWALAPAVWLFVQWFYYISPAIENEEPNKALALELAKHEQSIVRAMWAAFLAVTIVIYKPDAVAALKGLF